MGGKNNDAPIIGYKYYLGVHFLWCHSPIDSLLEVRADNRLFWSGNATEEMNLEVDEEELFGETEGGISGTFRLEPGLPTQGQNSYLNSNISSEVPAYRGVVGFVLNRMYLGNNPYLKRWSAKFQRIFKRKLNGAVVDQWFPEVAGIGTVNFESQSIAIVVDDSGSMEGNRIETARQATVNLLNQIRGRIVGNPTNDIYVGAFDGGISSIQRRNVTQSDVDDIISWVNSNFLGNGTNGTDYVAAVSELPSFFNGDGGSKTRTLVFLSDGEPLVDASPSEATLDGISGLTRYAIGIVDDPVITGGITSGSYTGPATIGFTDPPVDMETNLGYIDNTPADGIPTVDIDSVDSLDNFFTFPFESNLDMNPAHIVRECLTNDEWGLGYPEADLNDQSFEVAAYILWQERFGISLAWSQQSTIEDFIQIVLNHADATLYVDRLTGKWTMRLIRGDYDVDDLDIVTDDDIVLMDDFITTTASELVNSVTIRYNDRDLRGEASLTVNNLAQITQLGQVVPTTVSYPGIWRRDLANRVALRDLRSLSTPLFSGTVHLTRAAAGGWNPGDVFRISSSRYELTGEPVRVMELDYGNGMENTVKVRFVQDVFGVGTEATIEEDEPDINEFEDIFNDPQATPVPMVHEEPFYQTWRRLGSAAYNTVAGDDADFGFIMIGGGKGTPDTTSISTRLDAGSGYVSGPLVAPGPFGYLATEITDDAEEDTVVIDSTLSYEDLDLIAVDDFLLIGEEYFLVTAVDPDNFTFTVLRGIMDTVPAWHSPGSGVLAWKGRSSTNTTQYTDADSVDVKLLANTGNGQYSEASAVAETVVLDSRNIRPYPPGNMQVGSSYDPISAWTGTLSVTWAHRDRNLQTGETPEDFLDGNIGPEAGTTYTVEAFAYDLNGDRITPAIYSNTGITGTSDSIDTSVVTDDSSYLAIEITVKSVRDGYDSYQQPSIWYIKDNPDVSNNSTYYFNVNDASSLYTDSNVNISAQYDDEQIGSVTPQ